MILPTLLQTTAEDLPIPPELIFGGLFALVIGYALLSNYREENDNAGNSGEMPVMDFHAMFEEHRKQAADATNENPVGVEAGLSARTPGQGETVGEVLDQHQSLVAPAEYEKDTRTPIVDGEYVKTLIITDYVIFEKRPVDGFLKEVFDLTDVKFDATVYIRPFNQREGADRAKGRRQDTEYEGNKRQSEGIKDEQQKAKEIQTAVENGHSLFETEMVFTVRGDTVDEVEEAESKLRSVLTSSPAGCDVKVIPAKANDGLRATEPFGENPLADVDPNLMKTWMVAGAIGALLVSFQNPTHIEATGFEVGLHKQTQTPIFVDPFEREDGHALSIIGKQGGGKSVSAKSSFLEYVSKNDDVIGVVIEPLGNWSGVIESARHDTPEEFQAEHIIIGSNRGINPLDISEVPEERRNRLNDSDIDPLSESVSNVARFVLNFLSLRGEADNMPGMETLENAIWEAYYDAGITKDLDTHDKTAPTFSDVLDQLDKRVDNPEEYVNRNPKEADQIKEDALWFLRKLSPFDPNEADKPDGNFANFSKETEFSLDESDMYYLDLNRAEGNMGNKESLTMQLLIEQVYEMAKRRDEKLVLAMDEFRYLMNESMDLDFLQTLYRHQRHHEISPWLMTQTLGEFLEHPKGQQILNLQTIRMFHSIDEMNDDWRKKLNMPVKAMEAIKRAAPGSRERGFSDTIIEIDGQWREAEVHVPPKLMEIIEWDPSETDTDITDLPGVDEPTAASTGGRAGATTDGGYE